MSDAYVRVMMKRLAARAGIDKRVHAHGLRHTHAAQLRAEGVDIAIISRQLGHTSITTTARDLNHLAPMALIEAMRLVVCLGAEGRMIGAMGPENRTLRPNRSRTSCLLRQLIRC